MVFMASGEEYHEAKNSSQWLDQKRSLFTSQNFSENTNWETAAIHMSVNEEATRKETGQVNTPLVLQVH